MNTLVPYSVVVPSHRRTHNMKTLMERLPFAQVCVDEREEQEYLDAGVPSEKLILHARTNNYPAAMNATLEAVTSEAVCIIDDDFQYIRSNVHPRPKIIRDPDFIRAVIENGVNILVDLGLPMYGWSNIAHPGLYSNCRPYNFVAPVAGGAVIHLGRKYKYDETSLRSDTDLTLQVLLKDRVTVTDQRFYWCFGGVGEGVGGMQGQRTQDTWNADERRMLAKWGRYVAFPDGAGATRFNKKEDGPATPGKTKGVSIRVNRKSDLAIK